MNGKEVSAESPVPVEIEEDEPSTSAGGSPVKTNGTSTRCSGECKWFNVLKGWGFITDLENKRDVFVHQSIIMKSGFRSLGAGEKVEFEAKRTEHGWEAVMVTGPKGTECTGSQIRPMGKRTNRRIRCFNCGEFGTHVAAKCPLSAQPKTCYRCKSLDHLISECPLQNNEVVPASTAKPARPNDIPTPDGLPAQNPVLDESPGCNASSGIGSSGSSDA